MGDDYQLFLVSIPIRDLMNLNPYFLINYTTNAACFNPY